MNKIVKVLRAPRKEGKKYEFHGLYVVLVEGTHGENWEAHLTEEEYKVKLMKEKLFFEYNVPEKVIEEFESVLNEKFEEERIENEE